MAYVQIGIVTGAEIKKNKDSESNSLVLQCEISQPDDVQPVELYRQAGEDYRPPIDSSVVIVEAGASWKIAVACDDGIESEVDYGERILYSSENGVKKAVVYLVKDGSIELNGNDDNAVRFSELETTINELKDKLNEAIDALNLHTHQDSLAAPTTPPLLPPPYFPAGILPSTADISPAKIESIKVSSND